MNYVTTNIRIPEDDYMRLKMEAVSKRISFSEVIRKKICKKQSKDIKTEDLLIRINQNAAKLGKKLKGFDSVKIIREMREERIKHLMSL